MSQPLHHICFDKSIWSGGYAREIRNQLLVPLIWGAHVALHNTVSIVPVPDRHTLQKVTQLFQPIGDIYQDIDQLIGAIDMATLHDQVHPNDRALSELTMSAISRQIPFIRQGLVSYGQQAS